MCIMDYVSFLERDERERERGGGEREREQTEPETEALPGVPLKGQCDKVGLPHVQGTEGRAANNSPATTNRSPEKIRRVWRCYIPGPYAQKVDN